MKSTAKMLAAVLLPLAGSVGISQATVVVDMVTVGNPGNSADTTGYGAVNYTYQIGKYEISNAQYAEFLNTVAKSDPYGLYNPDAAGSSRGGIVRSGSDGSYVYTVKDGYANLPINYVSFADAARFVNWLTNGQGTASTETGSYDMSQPLATVTRMAPQSGQLVQYFVASEDEWYKAAFYDPTLGEGAGGYWDYATMSNTIPTAVAPPSAVANRANWDNIIGVPSAHGAYSASFSYYGTFDQEGNISEILDTILGADRVRRGGNWENKSLTSMGVDSRTTTAPTAEGRTLGFRIVMVTVPEPSTTMLFGLSAAAVGFGFILRKRHAVK